MYDWLVANNDARQVLTASRRLARTLRVTFADRQVQAGRMAWPTPAIDEWRDWAYSYATTELPQGSLPIVISAYQSKLLWERCLRREISDPLLNVGMLARQARDTWLRMREWCVPIDECQRRSGNRDQWLFAQAAASYDSILAREGWIDDSGVPALVIEHLLSADKPATPPLVLTGFDRISPILTRFIGAYREAGGIVDVRDQPVATGDDPAAALVAAESADAELRSAGRWARQVLSHEPGARLGIVVTQLESNAQRSLRLVKEGLVPGWQNAGDQQRLVVDMSYGRKLVEYPVVATAIELLSWLSRDLSTTDVGRLFRSSLLADTADDERIRAELELRGRPEQHWSPAKVLSVLQARAESHDGLRFVSVIAEHRTRLPKRESPAGWVTRFSELLQELGWPGEAALTSPQFQTVNRWRELLNEVARLELVGESMTLAEVLAHLTSLASETLFQPEGQDTAVSVMGPLEAAGMEFDGIWVTGASNNNWPPHGSPLPLLSRDLQRDFGMPDAVPADTIQYAQRVINRLAGSAPTVVFSYAKSVDGAEQAASALLQSLSLSVGDRYPDPGWHAHALAGGEQVATLADDPVPPVAVGEKIHGGAATIQRQFSEPFAAFAHGRLGVDPLWPIETGLPANIRGSLIHAALYRLYLDCPSQQQIMSWRESEVADRIGQAVDFVFAPHERIADSTLAQLLRLEKQRVARLLQGVIEHDRQREVFAIAQVEQGIDARIEGLQLHLRIDRVDHVGDNEPFVIDYKTGSEKRLLDRDKHPKDMQLIVYACALGGDVAGVGLLNVDSRRIFLDAAGRDLSEKLDWATALPAWLDEVRVAARQIAFGDVRVNIAQAASQARALGLLSRVRELQHDD